MEKFFTDFLTEISPALQNLLVLLTLFVIGQASEFIVKQRKLLNTKLTTGQRELLDILALRAVQAVEQVYKSEPNVVKMDKAITLVEEGLEKAGLNIDLDVIVNAVEAQVFQKNQESPKG
jgi:hypothetical protein